MKRIRKHFTSKASKVVLKQFKAPKDEINTNDPIKAENTNEAVRNEANEVLQHQSGKQKGNEAKKTNLKRFKAR